MDDLGSHPDRSPTVSILVTVFNRELYLAETLESVLDSSWTDFELIVVDDASTDQSLAVAEMYASRDKRIRVVANERNLGDYGNRAKAASLARGRYIKYVDSDDLIYRHSLALMVESLEKFPEASVALSHSKPEDEAPYPWLVTPYRAFHKHFLGSGCLSCGPSAAIIRRQAFEEVGGFRQEWKLVADTDLWLRLASRWPVVLLPPGLIWWRRHEGQEYTKDAADVVYLGRGLELTIAALNDAECPLTLPERDFALRKKRQHFARRLLSLAVRGHRPGLALELYRNSGLSLAELAQGLRPYR